jgi:hypothetical protein
VTDDTSIRGYCPYEHRCLELLQALEQRDALVRAGDVLATRLDETPAPDPGDGSIDWTVVAQRQRAVREWLAIAHPNGEGHPE